MEDRHPILLVQIYVAFCRAFRHGRGDGIQWQLRLLHWPSPVPEPPTATSPPQKKTLLAPALLYPHLPAAWRCTYTWLAGSTDLQVSTTCPFHRQEPALVRLWVVNQNLLIIYLWSTFYSLAQNTLS